jgi:hypothetical protein
MISYSTDSDRLTWDLVGRVWWHQDMGAFLTWLHLPEPPTWNTALPFIQVIDPEAERANPHEIALKEAALLSKLSQLGKSAQRALPLVEALEQFNSISELGPPVGEELPHRFEQLNTCLKMCLASEEEVNLEDRPMCSYCGILLSEDAPYSEVETLLMDVEQCVQETVVLAVTVSSRYWIKGMSMWWIS